MASLTHYCGTDLKGSPRRRGGEGTAVGDQQGEKEAWAIGAENGKGE